MTEPVVIVPRSALPALASRLERELEDAVSVHLSIDAHDLERLLGMPRSNEDDDEAESPFDPLLAWIDERQALGLPPSLEDVVRWCEDRA